MVSRVGPRAWRWPGGLERRRLSAPVFAWRSDPALFHAPCRHRLQTVGKACWDMSSSLDAWGSIETWQHNSPSEQVQDVTRNQSLHRFRLPVILNALSCVVLYCPSYKLATYLATTEGHWRKPHWRPRPRRLFHHPREPLSVL